MGQYKSVVAVFGLSVAAFFTGVSLGESAAFAQQMTAMDAGTASAYGGALAAAVGKMEGLQLQIDPDASQAAGLLEGSTGIIVVPTKGLTLEAVTAHGSSDRGAPLGYLFLTPRFDPLVNDQPAGEGQFRVIEYGGAARATAFLLAAKEVPGGDWMLWAYGTGEAPIIEVPFYPADERKSGTLSLRVEDIQDEKATLVLTAFGTYEASMTINFKK